MESQNTKDAECHDRALKLIQRFVPLVVITIAVKATQEHIAVSTATIEGCGDKNGGSSSNNNNSKQKQIGMHVIKGGVQTLKSLAGAAKTDEARAMVVGVLLSTIVPLLHEDVNQPASPLHQLALNHLLSLGTTYPKEFRHGLVQLSLSDARDPSERDTSAGAAAEEAGPRGG
ncbi:hypothetical protein DFQ26_003106 [Actinomortierella ambigua]|nr:hypothetical protein DFQ26_003106 [Actinomortierella ambigua]